LPGKNANEMDKPTTAAEGKGGCYMDFQQSCPIRLTDQPNSKMSDFQSLGVSIALLSTHTEAVIFLKVELGPRLIEDCFSSS
jgi:hypothetical protein